MILHAFHQYPIAGAELCPGLWASKSVLLVNTSSQSVMTISAASTASGKLTLWQGAVYAAPSPGGWEFRLKNCLMEKAVGLRLEDPPPVHQPDSAISIHPVVRSDLGARESTPTDPTLGSCREGRSILIKTRANSPPKPLQNWIQPCISQISFPTHPMRT